MTAGLVARVLVVLFAGAAIAWYAHGLRALGLREDGEATLRALAPTPDPAAVRSAQADFRRAARFNADPTADLDEAALLLRTGHPQQAADEIERVVHDNPASVRAVSLLSAATRLFDERRYAAVNARLLQLYGHLEGLPVHGPTIPAPDGRVFRVDPTRMDGAVDLVRVNRTTVSIGGWAADVRQRRRTSVVLVVSQRRVVAAVPTLVVRPDIARVYGGGLERSGFFVKVPRVQLEPDGVLQFVVYAADDGSATPLRVRCQRDRQAEGC